MLSDDLWLVVADWSAVDATSCHALRRTCRHLRHLLRGYCVCTSLRPNGKELPCGNEKGLHVRNVWLGGTDNTPLDAVCSILKDSPLVERLHVSGVVRMVSEHVPSLASLESCVRLHTLTMCQFHVEDHQPLAVALLQALGRLPKLETLASIQQS